MSSLFSTRATQGAAPADLAAIIESAGQKLAAIRVAIGAVIFGQDEVVDQSLTAILSGGHMLLIGVPGLAKTRLGRNARHRAGA